MATDMRIFAGGIATETNMFAPVLTGLDDFIVLRGADVLSGRIAHPSLDLTAVWGTRARSRSCEFVFGLNAWAEPSGITVRSAYERLRNELLHDLQAAMPVDIVLLMLHGAMVAQGYEDCEQDLIRRVRSIVGSQAVIGVELDLHCNLTEAKIADANIVVTFKEYPHVDIDERAGELFDLAVAAKRGEIRPTKALFDCQMVGVYPTSQQPLRGFVDSMMDAERHPGVLSVSLAHGFAFADLPHVSTKMLVFTDADEALAEHRAREFGLSLYRLRRHIGFDTLSLPMEVALSRAMASKNTPVVVADQSDNVGAGAPGDATFVLKWLLSQGAEDVATAIFYDPEVVKIAKRAGAGARTPVRLGGKTGITSGDPLDLEVTVTSLLEDYMHARPQASGPAQLSPLGDTAALICGSVDIVVASKRCQCYCPSIFTDHGIDWSRKRVLIPKSMQHFHGGFAPIAGEIIYMAAPGAVPPDPRQILYRRLDTTRLYPWCDAPLSEV
jgi:microcystin degradation protein MlrC